MFLQKVLQYVFSSEIYLFILSIKELFFFQIQESLRTSINYYNSNALGIALLDNKSDKIVFVF